MTKSELVKVVADNFSKYEEVLKKNDKSFAKLGSKTKAEVMINIVLDSITESLIEDKKVSISGFGTFEVRDRSAKECINPRSGERITVPAYKAAVFKSGKNLKDALNETEND
jgi:nucleoid DNA-binding protein